VEDLVELRAPEGATTRYPFVTPEWARRWPAEEVWIARRRGRRRDRARATRRLEHARPGGRLPRLPAA